MCTKQALQAVDIIATDDINQLESFRKSGYFLMTPAVDLDLGHIVAGKKSGRNNALERTIAINLGVALDDMATAPLVYQKAVQKGLGTELPL
jgi:ornithine cyclodeaminase/alanine dehydrogenase